MLPESARPPATVMVVDDTPDNREIMTALLKGCGYAVAVFQGGREALEQVASLQPDLILLDVLMPDISGFETCRRLKAHEATREIPVIFMTALSDTSQKLAGFEAGAVDYVTKPLNGPEVLARVRTQIALADLRRELAARNAELEARNAELAREAGERVQVQAALQRSNAELEQLAYVASHDMQEPLRMIASYLQLVEQRYQDKLDSDGREFIAYAVDGAKRLQRLINDLLTYSRVGTKAKPFEPVSLDDVVRIALGNLRIAIEESGASVEVGPLPVVSGDASQLVQLLQNVLGNAIKFRGREAPRVTVQATFAGGEWTIAVRDNGIGIAPAHFERIFVLFQRLHGHGAYPGTGIGLALCKRIVERHGGRIGVESAQGQGATFHFTLPAPTRS